MINMDEKIKKAMESFERGNITCHFAEDRDKAREIVLSMIKKDDVIGYGGSLTLDECAIRDELRKKGYRMLDWQKDGTTPEEKREILEKTMTCDVFLSGSNAVTMDGKLYNVDGRGNRVSALTFGPKKVIVVAGKNKLVRNLLEARERVDTVAGPLNAKRLNRKTGCIEAGFCVDCDTPERICRHYMVTDRQYPGRMNLIIVDEKLGL